MILSKYRRMVPVFRFTFGDGDEGGSPGTEGNPPPDTGTVNKGNNNEKRFSQSDVNLFISRKETEYKKQMETLQADLEKLRESSVAPEVKEELSKQINTLESKYKTQAELAKRAEDNLKKQHQEALTNAQTEAKTWKDRFTTMKVQNDVFKALGDDAKNPEHIIQILGDKLYLEPEKHETRVKMANAAGEEMDMNIVEAVTLMKEDVPKYGYLFNSPAKGGLGAGKVKSEGFGKEGFSKDPATFQKQFLQFRKDNNIV